MRPVQVDVIPVERINTPYTREELVARATALLGQPFKHLPGNPPEHQVLGEFAGVKIRVEAVEQLFNDWELMCDVYGPDAWASIPHDEFENAVLALARRLYGVA